MSQEVAQGTADRRRTERRQLLERRASARAGSDRRIGTRRGALLAASVLTAMTALGSASTAEAQIFTRVRNGVVEATNAPATRDFRLTYPGKGRLIHSRGFRGVRPSDNAIYDQHIAAACSMHGVSIPLVRAVIQTESAFDYLAVSSAGAQGLMQLMPDTARRMGVSDSFDPRQNIFGGVRYLRLLLDMFQGDVSLAAAGYNAGENAVLKYNGIPPYKETQGYVQKIHSILGAQPAYQSAGNGSAAAFFTPNSAALGRASASISFESSGGKTAAAGRTPVRVASARPAKPRTYYRWQDKGGILHITQQPPSDGVVYSTIRAID